jgi:hypothetical protein
MELSSHRVPDVANAAAGSTPVWWQVLYNLMHGKIACHKVPKHATCHCAGPINQQPAIDPFFIYAYLDMAMHWPKPHPCKSGISILTCPRLQHWVPLLLTISLLHACPSSSIQHAPLEDLTSPVARYAYATFFEGCYAEGCGCGIPPELLKDMDGKPIPYVALNVQNTGIRDEKLMRPLTQDSQLGLYNNGRNCGRWVQITFQANCAGQGNDAFSDPPTVCGKNPFESNPLENYQVDQHCGTVVYAVVADSCQDSNYWCALAIAASQHVACLVHWCIMCSLYSTMLYSSLHTTKVTHS